MAAIGIGTLLAKPQTVFSQNLVQITDYECVELRKTEPILCRARRGVGLYEMVVRVLVPARASSDQEQRLQYRVWRIAENFFVRGGRQVHLFVLWPDGRVLQQLGWPSRRTGRPLWDQRGDVSHRRPNAITAETAARQYNGSPLAAPCNDSDRSSPPLGMPFERAKRCLGDWALSAVQEDENGRIETWEHLTATTYAFVRDGVIVDWGSY
jgi:hypothetical protein